MALITQLIRPTPADDVQFRDCVQKIRDAITGLGWVRTADTGQIDTATVLKPAASTPAGYDIFRFDDALQATAPFFLKIEYGLGSGTNVFGWWITIGTGTNGAGVLAGNVSVRFAMQGGSDVGVSRSCTFAGAANRLAIVLFENHVSTNSAMGLVIERSHADNGSDTGERVDMVLTGPSATAQFHMLPSVGQFTVPAQQAYLPILLPTSGSALKGTDVGVFALFPNQAGPLRNPMFGFLACLSGDVALGSEVPISMYGVTRTYRNPASHHGPGSTSLSMGNTRSGVLPLFLVT